MRSISLIALTLALAPLGASCGPKEGRTLGGVDVGTRVEAPGAAVARYSTAATGDPVIGEATAAGAVRRGVEAASAEAPMAGDERLATLASWVAAHLAEGGRPPPHDVTDFFARHLGLVEPVPHILVLGNPSSEGLEAGVTDSVRQFLARQRYSHWGASVAARDGLLLTVIALSWRGLTLDPVSRELAPGNVRLQGELGAGLSRPTFVITDPSGSTERLPAGSSSAFQVNLPMSAEGTYRVEILAASAAGDTVVANFPLYIGVDAPNFVVLEGDAGPGEAGTDDAVAASLLDQINDERSRVGVPPLARMAELDAVAHGHSVDMRDNAFVAHASPRTGTAAQRVAAAGVRTGLVLENIGRGYGASEIHRGLMASPGHRANLLNPDITHVGLGVVSEAEGDRRAFLATEVFVRMNRSQDLAGAPERLVALINQGREARGAHAVELDPNLAQAAQDAAVSYFADPTRTRQDTVDDASAGLRQFAIAFSRVGGLMTVVDDIAEASRLEPTFDPEVAYIGVGIAQGPRPDTPPNSLAVVILLAWPR
ncbi:MAG: hypothetical protein CMN30_14390 [Sandaracinus sp.]|nr:hypothetical protein [Sandaracinus sp.]